MGQRLLALACISSTTALQCHVGRAHDSDLKAHSSDFVDGVALQTCPSDADVCCVTFEAARCCTLEGNYYAVSDGACGSQALCGNLESAADKTCDGYKLGRRGRCTWQQFSLREEAGEPPVVTLVDGPKALDSFVRPYLGESGHVLPFPNSTSCKLNSQCPATRKHHSCVSPNVGTRRVGLVDEAARKTTTTRNASTTCSWRSGSQARGAAQDAAPEAEGWCAAFSTDGVRAKHCVPWSSKTHVYDVGSRGWALGFLKDRARDPAARRVIVGLRRKMIGKAVAARPSFSEALAWLDVRARGIKEELL